MNGLALCSGIGGLDLGLHIAIDGYRTICHVEREAYCAAALVARMEDEALDSAPVWDDITTFDGHPWRGIVDIISAGYPCQPFSVAGRRAGVEDPRHLWPHVARIIGECEPRFVFLENVSGHLNLGFDEVAEGLDGMDYEVAATLLTASELGATHRRERLFVLGVGNPGQLGQPRLDRRRAGAVTEDGHSELGNAEGDDERGPRERAAGRQVSHRGSSGDVADPSGPGLEGRGGPQRGSTYQLPAWPPSPSDEDTWREILDGWPELAPALAESSGGKNRQVGESPPERDGQGEETQPPIRGVDDGSASRVDRLRALGNAVVPAQAAVAFVSLARELELIE